MVGSLGPAVSGVERRSLGVVLGFVGATMLASLIMASSLVLVGELLATASLEAVEISFVTGALILSVSQVLGSSRPLQSEWQVPERWRRQMAPDVLAAFYGFILGFGVFTAVVVSAFWVFLALSLIVDPWIAIAGWGTYAAVRSGGFVLLSTHLSVERFIRQWPTHRTLAATSIPFTVLATWSVLFQ
jgi:hypothetical protein